MKIRRNIPEGSEYASLPKPFGFGRVLTHDSIHEYYTTVVIRQHRYFIAFGFFNTGQSFHMYLRWRPR